MDLHALADAFDCVGSNSATCGCDACVLRRIVLGECVAPSSARPRGRPDAPCEACDGCRTRIRVATRKG